MCDSSCPSRGCANGGCVKAVGDGKVIQDRQHGFTTGRSCVLIPDFQQEGVKAQQKSLCQPSLGRGAISEHRKGMDSLLSAPGTEI